MQSDTAGPTMRRVKTMPLLTSPGSAAVNRKPCFVPLDDERRDFNAGAMATAIAAVRKGLNSTPLSEPPSKPEPDLQVLRKRTPEQEEAIAAAATAIAEAAAKSEEASEEEREPATIRVGRLAGKVWWDALDGAVIEECLEHTPLVDIMFLVLLARLGGVLPCGRQNMPPAAFITKDNLWRLKLWNKKENKASLPVLAFSYAWLDWFHPDRMGAQLRMLLPFLEAMLASAQADSPYCTVGVMVDFVCLPQVPRETEADQLAFTRSLNNMFEWYCAAHPPPPSARRPLIARFLPLQVLPSPDLRSARDDGAARRRPVRAAPALEPRLVRHGEERGHGREGGSLPPRVQRESLPADNLLRL